MQGSVYLIPSVLDEAGIAGIPLYITTAVKDCQVLFVENERTARRFLKQLWRALLPGEDIRIEDFEWYAIHKAEEEAVTIFKEKIKQGKNIGIISEAGCPGIADPGQILVMAAQQLNAAVKPLVGPSSILLALMGSGLNGQQFKFNGYLPIDASPRITVIKELETESKKKNCTQIFIETPYRNNQLLETLLKICQPFTRLCIAANLTGEKEYIRTQAIQDWKKEKTDLHKQPVIFLILAG